MIPQCFDFPLLFFGEFQEVKHLANPGQGAAEFLCHLPLGEFFQLNLEGDFPGLDDGIPVRLPGFALFYWLVEPCQVPQSGSLGDPVGVPDY